ncbi:MAG TPA: transketolase family protein [Clostridiales bacterium]|nr:transketolase family protein [Clostridiales bacterium]
MAYKVGDKIATREAYGDALVEFGAKYPNVVVLDADLAEATKTIKFKKAYPERFFDCGIAESNMASVAAGLASMGLIPFASSFAMFTAGRAFEPIRNSIGYPHLNVKIGATHAGITVGEDGATHQCLEDLGTMRLIPGMTVLSPADAVEARAAVEAAINIKGPVYIRFGRYAVPVIFEQDTYKMEVGRGIILAEGRDAAIFATGFMTHAALEARALLKNDGIDAAVINIHTVKPIDRELVIAMANTTGAIVTCEEHNIIGGLGDAVSEVVCECCPVPVFRVGVRDQFGRSGKVPPLLEHYGLTPAVVAEKVKAAVALKK